MQALRASQQTHPPVISATVSPASAAACRSMRSLPTPAVTMSSRFFAFWILSLVMLAGWKGVVIRMLIVGSCLLRFPNLFL